MIAHTNDCKIRNQDLEGLANGRFPQVQVQTSEFHEFSAAQSDGVLVPALAATLLLLSLSFLSNHVLLSLVGSPMKANLHPRNEISALAART